jgi:PAS domain S-box-containing protein
VANPLLGLLDLLGDPVLVLATDGRLAHANPSALRQFGVEVGTTWPLAEPVVGAPAVAWVAERLGRRDACASVRVQAPGGRVLALAWQVLDERWAALRLAWVDADVMPLATAAPIDIESTATVMRLFADSPFPVMLQAEDFRLVDANESFARFVGRPLHALLGQDPLELAPREDWPELFDLRRRIVQFGDAAEGGGLGERRFLDAQGRERWYRASRRSLTGRDGSRRVLSVLQDSTGEHQARERADRSLRELDQWFDLATVGMVLFDGSGLLVRTNRAFETLIGEVPVQLSDAPAVVQELLGWSRQQGFRQRDASNSAWHGRASIERADGAHRSLHAIVRAYPVGPGQRRYLAVIEDRSAEEERDLVQSQMGTLMDTAGVGLVTLEGPPETGPGALAPANQDVRLSTGVLQSINRELVLPESLGQYDRLQAALRDGQRAELRYAIRHPQLGTRWLLTRVEPTVLSSGRRSTSVVTLDVTETQQAQIRGEQLLRELTTILEGTTAGIAYVRGDVLVRCNPRFESMLGLPGGRAVGSSLHELFGRYPQAHRVAAETLQALTENGVFETEIELRPFGRAGSASAVIAELADPAAVRWVSLSVRRAIEPTPVPEAIAVLTDITRLKTQQRDLEVLLRDRDLMFSLSDVGIAFIRDGHIQRANDALAQLSGYRGDEMSRLRMDALFPSLEEYERQWADETAALSATGRWTGERQLRRRDGRLIWVQASKRLVLEGQTAAGVIASYVNVDDRRRAQEAVAVQAERTRAVLDSVLVGIVTVGPQGIEWMNRSARRMFAGDLADFIGMPISTVATPEPDHPFLLTRYLDELLEGQAETFECRVKARDGREFWVVGNVVAIGHEASERQLTYALLDIERRRQAEVRIVETQASLQRIIEAAPMAITLVDAASLTVMQANHAAAAASGRSVDELIGLRPDDWLPSEVAARQLADMRRALEAAAPTQSETREGSAGSERVWETRFVPVGTPGGPAEQLLVVATDVTEQRLAQEARFEAALAQREMLVKEVHHRIKNNLQGVAGLLEQIAKRKPEVAHTIAEVVGQVQAIAQVYGLQVGMSGALRVQSVVQAITQSVERTFGRRIRFDVSGPEPMGWILPEAEAIPIALSLNELLTNAIKHSPAGEPVDCVLMSDAEDLRVMVANLGQVPDGFRLERFPMGVSGLGLVRALLPRRSASLVIEPRADHVVATLHVRPPGVKRENALTP